MIQGILRYWQLGRGKAEGVAEIIANDENDFNTQLAIQFSKHLMSRDISFENGEIFAGFRKVGYFEFIAAKRGD